MVDTATSSTIDILKHFHELLDARFRVLHESRSSVVPVAPVFALEHGLEPSEFEVLQSAVRSAVADRFGVRYRKWWLPYVVYAANIGYDYTGVDYWRPFAERTPGWEQHPGWDVNGNRRRIRLWFEQFADQYGGARPTGAWATFFKNIAWPITHAVLPAYLQRQLAQLLYESRAYLSSDLLKDPDALGESLAARTGGYADRFRIFCSQHALLGRVAAALLAGEEESEYLTPQVLHRIVQGLSAEQRARVWLQRARQTASHIRTSGFRPASSSGEGGSVAVRRPTVSDPRLVLKRLEDGWQLFAEIPDLTPLGARLPHLYDELSRLRARLAGVERPVAPGRLLFPGEQRLGILPQPGQPFIELERGSDAVNRLIADQCRVTIGPWWVFRQRTGAHAVEVKGKSLRPGWTYMLLGHPDVMPPSVSWIRPLDLRLDGARGYELVVPQQVPDEDADALSAAGLSFVATVAVRPVGTVPLRWDGEGAAEYLAGESVMLAVRAERVPEKCVVTIDNGAPELLAWPSESSELYLGIDDLHLGVHEISTTLISSSNDVPVAVGTLLIAVREPHYHVGGSAGEGIRMLASPARPLMTELWDGRATIAVEGPPGTQAQLTVTLRDAAGAELTRVRRNVDVPFTELDWRHLAHRELRGSELRGSYDHAESCELAVAQSGIGFATLVCERAFTPLRWLLRRRRNGGYEAHLIDRTDGADTKAHLFDVGSPLVAVPQSLAGPIVSPSRGGLLHAAAGDLSTAIVLPPDPNEMFRQRSTARPFVHVGYRSVAELVRLIRGHHAWLSAELPADPFANAQRQRVLGVITGELAGLIAGRRWARQERIQGGRRLMDYVDTLWELVGHTAEHRAIAQQVSRHFHEWAKRPRVPIDELTEIVGPLITADDLSNPHEVVRFMLRLCDQPGSLLEWEENRRQRLLEGALASPVLVRAVRFAVLGREAFVEGTEGEASGR
jgi:hypothetical protein